MYACGRFPCVHRYIELYKKRAVNLTADCSLSPNDYEYDLMEGLLLFRQNA